MYDSFFMGDTQLTKKLIFFCLIFSGKRHNRMTEEKSENYVFVEKGEEEYVFIDENPKVYHYPHSPKPKMNMIFLLKNIMFKKSPSVDLSELMRV